MKNSKKIFLGGDRGPPKPPCLGQKWGFGDPCLIHLFGVSAFWRGFTGYFTLTLSHFMKFFVKMGFLVENLVILYSEIRPKCAFFQMRFRNLKWLQILVLRHLPHCHIIDTWIFVRNGVKRSFLTCSLRPNDTSTSTQKLNYVLMIKSF